MINEQDYRQTLSVVAHKLANDFGYKLNLGTCVDHGYRVWRRGKRGIKIVVGCFASYADLCVFLGVELPDGMAEPVNGGRPILDHAGDDMLDSSAGTRAQRMVDSIRSKRPEAT